MSMRSLPKRVPPAAYRMMTVPSFRTVMELFRVPKVPGIDHSPLRSAAEYGHVSAAAVCDAVVCAASADGISVTAADSAAAVAVELAAAAEWAVAVVVVAIVVEQTRHRSMRTMCLAGW